MKMNMHDEYDDAVSKNLMKFELRKMREGHNLVMT